MYDRFYGFSVRPFALTPDPAFLFLSRQHGMALTLLEYGLQSQASFALLTGEVGSGKTTLLRQLVRQVGTDAVVALISNTHVGFRSLHPWVAQALEVVPADDSEVAIYEAIVDCFIRQYAQGRRTLLIVDEAQNLPASLLEELRLLSNVNSEKDLVLQVLLVGQPELRSTLQRPELRQFAQRVSVDFHLRPLGASDTSAYVRHRLQVAGRDAELFSPESLALIHDQTAGVPRLINQLCDLLLVYGFADGAEVIDESLVRQALSDRESAMALPIFAGLSPAAERAAEHRAQPGAP
ncbi:MAG: AAA family ATPase [Proteobacteria bacterium]|nr:AAA family ATPase [Pseudomonadota bacterium]